MFTLNPCDNYFLDTLDFILTLIGGVGAFYLFFVGLSRYSKEQTWKRKEFIANEIKEFNADKVVKNAMLILDWEKRYIELFPDKEKYEDRFVKINRKILKSALVIHENVKKNKNFKYKKEEVAIRDTFDHLFSYFERYNQFLDSEIITIEEIEPYLKYWIKKISEKLEPDIRNSIYDYINLYEFEETKKLFGKFNIILP